MPPRPPKNAYVLDTVTHKQIFHDQIVPEEFGEIRPVSNPVVLFVGAQPGSGKSRVQDELRSMVEARDGIGSVMEIVGDDFRTYHPDFQELVNRWGPRATYYTDIDSGRWVERAIKVSQNIRTNVVLEGTLRRSSVTLQTARSYKDAGFRVELHVSVVHEYQSRLYIVERYIRQISMRKRGRYVIRASHDVAYRALPRSFAAILRSKIFDRVVLYNVDAIPIAETTSKTKNALKRLQEILEQERRMPSESKKNLMTRIDSYLWRADQYGETEAAKDLVSLRSEVDKLPA